MSKNTMKIISVIAIIMTVIMSVSTVAFAFSPSDVNVNAGTNTNQIQNVGNSIATVIRTIGIIIAVIVLMVLGIKYMMGSAEEKAEYKKTMIPYVIGAVLLAAAVTIAGAVVEMAGGLNNA